MIDDIVSTAWLAKLSIYIFSFLVAECNSASDPVCLFACLSIPNFVPNFFCIIKEVIEVDELDEGNISAAAGK